MIEITSIYLKIKKDFWPMSYKCMLGSVIELILKVFFYPEILFFIIFKIILTLIHKNDIKVSNNFRFFQKYL